MSLFTNEEVCEGCIFANFHECCGKFCSCEIDQTIDTHRGVCMMKEEKEPETNGE